MGLLFSTDDFGKGPNCLMYAIYPNAVDLARAETVFRKIFRETNGNGPQAFEEMCRIINLRFERQTSLSSANLAISSFTQRDYRRDYEGILQLVAEYPDYHVIRLRDRIWMEKNSCFRKCNPTPVSEAELSKWKQGPTPDTIIAYYAILG